MSRTLTLHLPDELYSALERLAAREGRRAEEVGAAWLTAAIERVAADPVMRRAGSVNSRTPDLAARHDDYANQQVGEEPDDTVRP